MELEYPKPVPVEALLPLVSPRAPFPRTFHATVLPGWAGG